MDTPKTSRFGAAMASLRRTPKWLLIGVPVVVLGALAYQNASTLKAGATKATDWVASVMPAAATQLGAKDQLASAREAFAAGNVNGAIEGYRAFIAANPKDISAHGELGNVYYTVGAGNEAAQAYFEAAKLALEKNEIEVAEQLIPVISEVNPMLAEALDEKLFEAIVRADQARPMPASLTRERAPFPAAPRFDQAAPEMPQAQAFPGQRG